MDKIVVFPKDLIKTISTQNSREYAGENISLEMK